MTLEARKLWRAKPEALLRLARFVGAPVPPRDCRCTPCLARLIAHVRRRL